MTRAEELRQRAREVDDQAWCIRWDRPREYHALTRVAAELREIADHLPPERVEP